MTSIEFGEPLSVPFSEVTQEGAAVLPPSTIGIDGRIYLLDTASEEWRREGVNVIEQRNTTSNRDLLLLPQGVWRHMFESWHQGAGQSNLDRDDALPMRFAGSYGVNVWERYRMSLLNDVSRVLNTQATPGVKSFLHVHNGLLVVCSGNAVIFISPDMATQNTVVVGASAIVDTTYDGEFIYALDDDGTLWKVSPQGASIYTITWAVDKPDAASATFVAYSKDYLIVGYGQQLWDVTDPAKPVKFYTSPVTGFTWKDAVDGDRAIYLIGGAGDKHVVHSVKVADDGSRLMPASVAAALPDGEIGCSIGSYLGFVFVGTERGVRMAVAANDGALTLGAIIPATAPVYGFEGQDRFVWFTNSEIESKFGQSQAGFPDGLTPGLSRLDLTTFTTTEATPAYAADLVAAGVSGTVRSVVTWGKRRVFSIDGVGVFAEDLGRLVPQGWVTHGTVSFGVEDPKTGLYAQFKWLPLEGKVGMYAAYDSQRYTELALKDVPDSVGSGNVAMRGQRFSRVNMGAVLYRDESDTSKGPVMTRWEFRAVPVKGVASRWYLPIINHAQLEIDGQPINRNPRDELMRLMYLVQSGVMFPLQESGVTYQVTARDFQWKPRSLSPDGKSWQGTFMLVCEEIA